MRNILAAAALGMLLGVAGASSSGDQTPESRAYFGFSFGGERIAPRDFHYGLRLDHDSRFVEGPVAPLMQLDFTRQGLSAARVNGLSVLRPQYRLQQAEAPAEAPAEVPAEVPAAEPAEDVADDAAAKPGFFSRIGAFFGGLFGGGDEAAPAEETAAGGAPEEVAAGEEVTEGMFLNFSVVDWGLLAVGAVGLGFAAGEVSNGDESDEPGAGGGAAAAGGAGGAGGVGGAAGGLLGGLGGLAGGLGGFLPGGLTSPRVGGDTERDAEYRKWLDGGTGQMGDLGGG